jgi:hypothetical protein
MFNLIPIMFPFEFKLLEAIILFVLLYIVYNYAYKKGGEKSDAQCYSDGYKEGVKCVENEIKELAKLSDEEILERIKNTDKNDS